jgi:hypothetical protein
MVEDFNTLGFDWKRGLSLPNITLNLRKMPFTLPRVFFNLVILSAVVIYFI